MQNPPRILYLASNPQNPSQRLKLAGMRRYAAALGWDVSSVAAEDSTPAKIPQLLAHFRPAGCIDDGVGRIRPLLPPRLFGDVPVVYIGYPKEFGIGHHSNFQFDPDAIAAAALRELSIGLPPCYAAVGFPRPRAWSVRRVAAFRKAVASAGGQCLSFRPLSAARNESNDSYAERLSPWLAKLPVHCAVFAVSDETAALVLRAAQAARRPIPRSLTLLSVDNISEICESASPPISSIPLDFERLGYLAARTLVENDTSPEVAGPLLVMRRKSTSGSGRHEQFIMDAIESIRAEACNGLRAADVIARYPVSKRLFTMRFREATGHSVLDEILHVRLEKACTLLARTDTTVGAVPGLCGFSCDRTLDALFRSRFGMSMQAWRKKNTR